jgi:Spy/CpxP family protein refolding chaperone
MMKPRRVAALYLAVVFIAGGLFGFVAHGLYTQTTTRAEIRPPDPQQFRERYLDKLERVLTLTPAQKTQVAAVLDETGNRFREQRERMDPEFAVIRQQQRQQIRALLSPEQQEKYQKMLEEWEKRHQKHGHSK